MVLKISYLLALGSVIFVILLGTVYCSTLNAIWNTEKPHILEIICNVIIIKNQSTIHFENAQQQTVEVQRNGTSCNQQKGTLPILHCGCNLDNNAVCNVLMSAKKNAHGKDQCDQWRCLAGINGVLKGSNHLNVCLTVDESTGLQRRTVSCSKYLKYPDVTRWNVEGRFLNSYTNSTEIIKLNAHNIRFTYFDKQNNGSIYVCKLEEEHQLEWTISMIYHTAACSEVNLSKRLSGHTVCGTGNPTITEIIEEYSATECPSVTIKTAVNVTLCDAFNRVDMGARQFLGNVRGSFKLEVLTIVRKFYIKEFGDQTNITINETRNVTFICDGDGNPPPTLTLVSTSLPFTTRYSHHLEHTKTFSSSQDTDTYLCIASNGLGNDSKSIYVDVITFKVKMCSGEDGSPPITVLLCVGSAIIILMVALYLLKRRYEMLKILHKKDVTIELATVEEVNRTRSSTHNNDTNLEEEGSQNRTRMEFNKSPDRVRKTREFCNETYAVYNPKRGEKEFTADGFVDHNTRLGKETSGVAVQGIPGVCNELYAYWTNPSTSRTDNTRNKDDIKKEQQNESFVSDDIKKEQGYKTRRNQNELGDCTYSVVNKNTRKHIDHASKDSVSTKANIIQKKTDAIYRMAKEPNDKDSAV